MSEGGAKGRWTRWLLLVATLALLAIFARSVDWGRAWSAVAHADLTLLGIATAANLASLVVKGVRWWLFLDAIGIPGVGLATRATLAGAALNNVLVANGGDAARVAAMARRTEVSSAAVLATLAIDRFTDLATYALLFVAAAFTLSLPPEFARWRTPGLLTIIAIAVVVALLVARANGKSGRLSPAETAGAVTTVSRAGAYWRRIVATSASVATAPRLAIAVSLAMLAWAGQWATFHYAAHAAAFPITASGSLLALLVVNASFLVRLTPGNVGVFQLLYALAASSVGLDRNSAVAVAFLIQLVQYIPVTVVGLLLAPSVARGKRTSSVTEIAEPNPIDRDQPTRLSAEAKRGA